MNFEIVFHTSVMARGGQGFNDFLIKFRLIFSHDFSSPPCLCPITFHGYNTQSTVDYILVSSHFQHLLFNLSCPRLSFGDHYPHILSLSWLHNAPSLHSENLISDISAHRRNGVRIKWEKIIPDKFLSDLIMDKPNPIDIWSGPTLIKF